MTFSAFRIALAVAAGSSLLLAGCGGGGGSGSSAPSPDRNAAIKSANATTVAAQAYWALDFLNGQINASVLNVNAANDGDLSARLCPFGGSASRTIDTGTITITDNKCDNGFWVSDGTSTIVLSNLQPGSDPFHDPAWEGRLTITFNFHASLSPDVLAETGDLAASQSQTGDLTIDYQQTAPNAGTFQVTNNNLQSRFAMSNQAIARNISNLNYTGSIDASSGINTLGANFTLSGSFGKLGTTSYDVKTKANFKRPTTNGMPTGNPTEGALTVTATDKSSLTLTAVNTGKARLDIDWNGDNVIDSSTSVSWDELNTQSNAVLMLYN